MVMNGCKYSWETFDPFDEILMFARVPGFVVRPGVLRKKRGRRMGICFENYCNY
jgi:hypothetical protein